MKLLSIDASTKTAGVAAMEEGRLLGEITLNADFTHSQKLLVMVDQLLTNLDTKLETFDAIAVSSGPGSFTGVRIGMATAMGLARAHGIGLIAVSSLEGLIHNVAGFEGHIIPIQDARRDQVYTAIFKGQERVTEDLVIPVDTLIARMGEVDGPCLLVGPDAEVFADRIIGALGQRVTCAGAQHLNPRAASIAAVAMNRTPQQDVRPNYVRKSQAERAYEAEHGKSLM